MKKTAQYIFVILLGLLVNKTMAQKITVHFEGTISDEDNVRLRDAVVEITQGELLFNSVKSDEGGNYNLYLPLNGEYNVTVSKNGFVAKRYYVNTKNIPVEKSQIQFATNVADIVLLAKYEGIDYSLFNRPMNKYSYNAAKDNIVYDEEYLEEMKAAMKEFKKMQGEQLKLAHEKALAEKKKSELLALEKSKKDKQLAGEKLKADKLAEEKHIADIVAAQEKAELEKKQKQAAVAGNTSVEQKGNTTVVSANMIIDRNSARMSDLLARYKPGITEEIFEGEGVYIIQRVLVKEDMVWVYQKKIFSWGGVACFRDKQPITESIFEQETKKS